MGGNVMAEIELKNIYKTFERKGQKIEALRDISLQVEKGDIYGVIGYSGAGKSTLIRMVNYLERPTRGQVLVEGAPLDRLTSSELRGLRKRIGMIFQHYNLLETRTVYDNIAVPLVLLKQDKNKIRERVTELLDYIGLSEKARSYPKELSGGQKQRVGIARALASNPSILLCDEVTSALDPQTTKSILELLKGINRQYRITILMITHEMSAIQQICNRVAVMENGEIIESGTVLDVFGNPRKPTTQSFVQTVLQTSVPQSIQKTLAPQKDSRLFKLRFIGQNAAEPVVGYLMKNFEIQANILFAGMSEIQDTTVGTMVLQIQGKDETVGRAVEFLGSKGVEVQEVDCI
jgi:D-methionine transport system ATP-binding protein